MKITLDGLIEKNLVEHTKFTMGNGEIISFYIDKKTGHESLERYETDINGNVRYIDTINTINLGHNEEDHNFIQNIFSKLDPIIDIDFLEMDHNNGSMIDIYHISYSSHFKENVIGQALTQRTNMGGWWDIFWKDSPLTGDINKDSDHNTIIHEIGHTLGLSHPFNDPSHKGFTSKNTIMSYNPSENGWDTWFSRNDLNALIKIWGRENDNGYTTYNDASSTYKYKRDEDNNLYIKTDIGYEDITNIERLTFTDKSIDVKEEIIEVYDLLSNIDSVSSKIYRLYNAAFARFPDKKGLRYWIENNISKKDTFRATAHSFVISDEFVAIYGLNSSNDEYISNLYQNVLRRTPDIQGANYWSAQLNSRKEDRAEVLIGFSESAENKAIFSNETNIF